MENRKGRARRAAWVGLLVVPLAAACSSHSGSDGLSKVAAASGGPSASPSTMPPPVLTTNPADGAVGIDPASPVSVKAAGGRLTTVTIRSAAGAALAGQLAPDGSSWTSSGPLAVKSVYTIDAMAQNATGQQSEKKTTFTTLTPEHTLTIAQYLPDDGTTVGVGQPIMVEFNRAPDESQHAAIDQAMTVTASGGITGAWHWISSTRVDWRPQQYWPSGTHVSVHLGLNGVKAGDATYGSQTRDWSFTIGSDTRAIVNSAAHHMTVYQNGSVVKVLPVDTGKTGYSTWGGTMIVLDKEPQIEMKSCSVNISCDPKSPLYYDLQVKWDVHLTDSGTYIHDASWDSQIGVDNTSHGCVHLREADAEWLYGLMKTGDVVTITGEPETVALGNGFGDWNLSWPEWTAS